MKKQKKNQPQHPAEQDGFQPQKALGLASSGHSDVDLSIFRKEDQGRVYSFDHLAYEGKWANAAVFYNTRVKSALRNRGRRASKLDLVEV